MKKVMSVLFYMQLQVLAYLLKNNVKFAGNVPLLAALTELETRTSDAKKFQQAKVKGTKGFADAKSIARKKLAKMTDAMRRRVQSSCKGKNDDAGFVNANITYSKIAYGDLLTSLALAQNVHDLASGMNAGDKTKYMVTGGDLTAMQDQINQVQGLNTDRRGATVDRQTAGEMQTDALKGNTKFIHETMDSLMGNYMNDKELYAGYLNSRSIINAPGRHAEITGKVVMAGTGIALPGVKVKASNGVKTFEDMTDTKGNYKMPVGPELYNLTFELPAYAQGHVNDVLVDASQKQVVNTILNKL